MTIKYTNEKNIPLYLALALVQDDYDYVSDPKYLSATSLMKPTKQIVLGARNNAVVTTDLEGLIPRFLGNSLHTATEQAWLNKANIKKGLTILGYDENTVNHVKVNPKTPVKGDLHVYIEQRGYKDILGYRIGGKFDCVIEGILHDLKTTSAFAWMYGTRDDDHMLQGSLYRWLHPEKITSNFIRICYIFTDWSKASASGNPKYPQSRIAFKDIELMSLKDTENWVRKKISEVKKFKDADEIDITPCTEEEMWLTKPKFKYYSDPLKISGRSTKNFTDPIEANDFMLSRGKGIVIAEDREAKKCVPEYCSAYALCSQREQYD